ncbi:replicative DNA helicase [Legionella longbeachae]|uniref:Replicative DNA helicase n=1 Tax=Legionella longbeachae serogroup 1 (strain NSW150) TaxID=661367 RepID=D3HQL0_LEGLN|nr:replicative DNA helicase [Legionella longbeachae]HBD7396455.1 replicative DNA helicase [Legionella pneumophila]ARM34847.1 replicative DNA helicase [Legionella longbeachae]EEZ95707.1 replicative DNA helicase [Legionella longbeachae D-4968]QEY50794.1 replicative DNA helicase [Legionella longbeachae]QIN31623.1 replicative DNA helicase [Legionella longbeachae]
MYELQNSKKTVDPLKRPPHSVEAEQSIIGGLMLDNQVWDKICHKLCETDFYRTEHRILFRAISALAKKDQPFDVVTLLDALTSHNELDDAGGEAYLFELANNTPSVANISAYAEIVREKSVQRQLIAVATEIADSAYNPAGREVPELLDLAETKVFAIGEQTGGDGGPENIKSILVRAVEKIDALYHNGDAITGLATGLSDLDEMTSGLQPSDLVIVAGRPSMGKTTLVMNMAEHAAIKSGKPVLVFSMEMPSDSLAMRMMSSLGRIDQHKIRTGKLDDDDWPRVTSAVHMLSEAPLFIDDTPALSPGEMRARARRLAKEHGSVGLIVVDYLQLMKVPGFNAENRTAEISEISRSLKSLAKELQVPVIALSQLNRSLEQRADKRPVMSDLRESGAIEQDADLICFIYRDEVYYEDSPDKGTAEIIVAKQRNGPIGKVRVAFIGKYTRFEDLAYNGYQGVD